MIVVIQCAARKAADAGHLRARDGRKVMFVANPDLAPRDGDRIYARPDDVAGTGTSWRAVLRRRHGSYRDFRMLPADASEPILFFGGREYIQLFCTLTADSASQRTVFYAGREPAAPGCRVRRFGKPFTNWHYQCAKAYVEGSGG